MENSWYIFKAQETQAIQILRKYQSNVYKKMDKNWIFYQESLDLEQRIESLVE